MSRIGVCGAAFVMVASIGCGSSETVRTDAGTDAQATLDAYLDAAADAQADAEISDAGPPADLLPSCGDAHMNFRLQFPGDLVIEGCAPLRDDDVRLLYQFGGGSCRVDGFGASADWSGPPLLSLSAVGGGHPFDRLGPTGDWGSVRLSSRDSSVCADGEFCNYNRNGPPGCAFEVTQMGGLGEIVEGRLTTACELLKADEPEDPRRPVVLGLTFRGPLMPRGTQGDGGPPCP